MRQRYLDFWQKILLQMMRFLARRLQRMSLEKRLRWGNRLGDAVFHITKVMAQKPQRVAQRNLLLAFGDTMDADARNVLVRRVFRHWGRFAMDFLYVPHTTDAQMNALIARVDGWDEHVLPYLKRNAPVIIIGAHFGNTELLARWIAAQGANVLVVAREPHNGEFGAYIRTLREQMGIRVAAKGSSPRALLTHLKQNGWLGVMPDQNSGDLFVPFFGVPCGTVAGPAVLSRRTGAPVIPVYCVRENDTSGRYRIFALPPILPDPTQTAETDQRRMMTEANAALEWAIRQYPEQWLWLHDRWKSAFEEKNRENWPTPEAFVQAKSLWQDAPTS